MGRVYSGGELHLLEELWDDLASSTAEMPVPEWQRAELTRRYEQYLREPHEGSPWPEVRERLSRLLS